MSIMLNAKFVLIHTDKKYIKYTCIKFNTKLYLLHFYQNTKFDNELHKLHEEWVNIDENSHCSAALYRILTEM